MLEVRVGADLAEDLDAVHVRHHHVQQHHVRLLAADQRHRLAGIGGGDEIAVADVLEVLAGDLHVHRLVVDDRDAGGGEGLG